MEGKVRKSAAGQAITEYLLLISCCLAFCLGCMGAFLQGASDFYLNLLRVICLPFP